MSRDKGAYTPIYRNEIQYELNNLIFEYRDLRILLSMKEITRDEFLKRVDEIKSERYDLVDGEEPVAQVRDYSTEQRMIDHEVLQELLEKPTDTFDDELEACIKDIEDLF